jgi:hypothetical protein
MGKGNKHGGGRGKQFSAPEDIEAESRGRVGKQSSKAGMMPSSDEDESEEEEEIQRGGQNPNAGMMPPSDDDDDEEEESEEEEDAAEKTQLRQILGGAGVPDSAMKELMAQLIKWKAGEQVKVAPKKAARAPEPTRKEREAMAGKKKEESSSDEEPDPEVAKKLEMVRKRREQQAAQRIAKDGWDRMKPMSADNHPPNTVWPPPGQAADVS